MTTRPDTSVVISIAWVLQEARRLTAAVNALDLPREDRMYLREVLEAVEREAAQLFDSCTSSVSMH